MNTELIHYGILGMRWGVRRYQNPDGSYTSAGKKRYKTDINDAHLQKLTTAKDDYNKAYSEYLKKQIEVLYTILNL